MWTICFALSIACLFAAILVSVGASFGKGLGRWKPHIFKILFAGIYIVAFILFLPVHAYTSAADLVGLLRTILLSFFNAMQLFALGCEFAVVTDSMMAAPEWLNTIYQAWFSTIFVVAPIFTFGFVLSLFKNLSSFLVYTFSFNKDVYVFSEINEKSLALASDIKSNNKKATIVFTDVFEETNERSYELIDQAEKLGAINFKNDILVVNFKFHSKKKKIYFFTISSDETENLNHTLKLIERYHDRENTNVYFFSTNVQSEILLNALEKGKVKVRRINEVRSLVNRILYEKGHKLFDNARPSADGSKKISAVVVGMGLHGSEMVKALSWFCQMRGYTFEINAFDRDPLAEEKFVVTVPELVPPQYPISVHSGVDVDTLTFAKLISNITDATYAIVSLGNDDINIRVAVKLRMYFEQMGIHPTIHAIVYNTQQKKALHGIKNFKGQTYDIDFIGDTETSYSENVIINSALESDALQRHLKWGNEEDFWAYEYNYRSSTASAIHMKARIHCKIPGSDKAEAELSIEERDIIETLEHDRWNAYMRSEGYVYSGFNDPSTRNDLAKMHHNLTLFEELSEEDKRKDSSVGSK